MPWSPGAYARENVVQNEDEQPNDATVRFSTSALTARERHQYIGAPHQEIIDRLTLDEAAPRKSAVCFRLYGRGVSIVKAPSVARAAEICEAAGPMGRFEPGGLAVVGVASTASACPKGGQASATSDYNGAGCLMLLCVTRSWPEYGQHIRAAGTYSHSRLDIPRGVEKILDRRCGRQDTGNMWTEPRHISVLPSIRIDGPCMSRHCSRLAKASLERQQPRCPECATVPCAMRSIHVGSLASSLCQDALPPPVHHPRSIHKNANTNMLFLCSDLTEMSHVDFTEPDFVQVLPAGNADPP
ncbi:hypothetical protein L1887_56352 [Cichorium endivia]|nr:hypothetical protein L1887_56352 [Cichorium endivia]